MRLGLGIGLGTRRGGGGGGAPYDWATEFATGFVYDFTDASLVTLGADPDIASVTPKVDGVTILDALGNATITNRPHYVTNPDGSGEVLYMDPPTPRGLRCTDAAADVAKFLHDAAGCSLYAKVWFAGTGNDEVVCDTMRTNASNVGLYVSRSSFGILDCGVGNGTGTYHFRNTIGVVPSGQWAVISLLWSEATGYVARVDGSVVNSGAVTGSSSSANPTDRLAIGGHSAFAAILKLEGYLAGLAARPGVDSDSDRDAAEAAMTALGS